jgi:hypothetical protein
MLYERCIDRRKSFSCPSKTACRGRFFANKALGLTKGCEFRVDQEARKDCEEAPEGSHIRCCCQAGALAVVLGLASPVVAQAESNDAVASAVMMPRSPALDTLIVMLTPFGRVFGPLGANIPAS